MIEKLINMIKARQEELKVALASGTPATWDMYQRMVGEHNGLELSLLMLEKILSEGESS